jgi:drug/metabolite transporter (DMT)-like permease
MSKPANLRPLQGYNAGYALAVAAPLIWATTSVLIKYLLDLGVPRLALAFWRDALIALACLAGLLVLRPRALRVSRHDMRGFALTGAISVGVYHALWVTSIALNGAAVATVLIYTFPTFVTIGAWLLFREPIRRPQIAALALALIGCALVVRAYDPAVLRVSWVGALVGLSTGMAHAGYVLFSQRAVQSHSPWTSLAYTMLFGALSLLAMTLLLAPGELFAIGASAAPWLVLIALALGPTLIGYALFTSALRHIPGRIASLIAVVEAPASTLLAVLLLGERLEWLQLLGLALILGAIGLPRLIGERREARTQGRESVIDDRPVISGLPADN